MHLVPWTRCTKPGFDAPVNFGTVDVEQQAAVRAAEVIDAEVAAALYDRSSSCGGLVQLRGTVGEQLMAQIRAEAQWWREIGLLKDTETRKEYVEGGRRDIFCFLNHAKASLQGSCALAFGIALFTAVCALLNSHRPPGEPALRPTEYVQLACFEGGAGYVPHKDAYAVEELDADLPDTAHAAISSRHITAILYLNEEWNESWGGAFRAHRGGEEGQPANVPAGEYVDLLPEGGSLVLFRSRDLLHEVRPCERPRYALTMWFESEPVRDGC